jgi:acetyltransferase-like isoleucine patch superfamily enzyme
MFGRGLIEVGPDAYVGDDVLVSSSASVTIGPRALLGHGVQLFDNNTHPTDPAERAVDWGEIARIDGQNAGKSTVSSSPIVIENDVWLGFGAIVMKGVRIGEGSVIAAASVVVTDIPPRSIVGGNPARILRSMPDRGQPGP